MKRKNELTLVELLLTLKITIEERTFFKHHTYGKICDFFGLQRLEDPTELPAQVKALFEEKGANVKECRWVNLDELDRTENYIMLCDK